VERSIQYTDQATTPALLCVRLRLGAAEGCVYCNKLRWNGRKFGCCMLVR